MVPIIGIFLLYIDLVVKEDKVVLITHYHQKEEGMGKGTSPFYDIWLRKK